LKIAPLLAQYLYNQKRLDLPGIGTFLLDGPVSLPPENNRQHKPVILEGVSFEQNSSVKEDPELIAFISSYTGKIKALASADLESHLELAKQFLNIGKPFLFEGIGTLSRIKSAEYTFAPGHSIAEPAKENQSRDAASHEQPATDYKDVFYNKKQKNTWKKPVAALLILVGIGLAVWGGYTVYKKTTAQKENNSATDTLASQPVDATTNPTIKNQDTTPQTIPTNKPDTAMPAGTPPTPISTAPAGTFKFVVETAAKERALARYNRLKKMGLAIQLETPDSASFKLFFLIPAAISDTAHIVDSLRRAYTPAGNKAYVEK
jgi:hypothetical protein